MPLSSGQRKYLKTLAHHMEPVVLVGKQGVTDTLVRSVAEHLEAHEMVKIRFNEFKSEKKSLSEEIAYRTGSEIVSVIGHISTLYRQHPEPEKRQIELPK